MTRLINADTGEVVLSDLEIADTFWRRFRGLQLRKSLPAGSGLLITPCSSVHTCFMRFAIDVIMLDQNNVIVGVRKSLLPWRGMLCARRTHRVIEVTAGTLEIAKGIRLAWNPAGDL